MTEKIIINGVNVAGCKYYKGKCMEYTHYCQIGCKECTDIGIKLCHYKQTERFKAKIDRLEQENKELKERFEKRGELMCNCAKQREKYRSALEEIREKIKSLNKDICNNCGWHNTDNCQPNGYVCHDLIEIKNKINEVLQ